MPKKRTNRRPIEPLTKDEFRSLIDASLVRMTVGGKRDAALLALLGGAGLRLQEALSLHVKDIETRTGRINVLRGKGAKQRTVRCATGMMAHVRDWLHEREKLGIGAGPFICGFSKDAQGKPMLQPHVHRMMKDLAERAGITKRVHPHGLRHSFTLWLAEAGAPIHAIKATLGHSSLQTTDHYLSTIFPEAVFDAVARVDL